MGRIFECKKEFELPKWDDDKDELSDEAVVTVEQGSVWELSGRGYICDGEKRLEDTNAGAWIEISCETLKEYFKDITDDNNEITENEYLRSGY